MRAGLAALVVAGSLAVSGCGILGNPLAGPKASGGTGSSASPSPSAVPAVPTVGECHTNSYEEQLALKDDKVIDCAESHAAETVHVGRFVGASAGGDAPVLDSTIATTEAAVLAAHSEAYLDCSANADKYLGHSWVHMLLELKVTVPSDEAWKNGDRWYRCDLYQVNWDSGDPEDRQGSLKTAWFQAVCLDLNKDDNPIVDCAKKHPSEFTGGYIAAATKTEPKTDKQYTPYHKKCYPIIGQYLGVSTSKVHSTVGDSVQFMYDFSEWVAGHRAVYCFTWTGEKTADYVTGSAKGRKGKGL